METPKEISKSIEAAGGKITRARPVCDGSRYWIVNFSANSPIRSVLGSDALATIGRSDSGEILYRAYFVELTPES